MRQKAAARLLALSSRAAEPLVAKLLADPDAEVRLAVVEPAVTHHIEAESEVLPWLSEADARLRVAACRVLALGASERAVAPLTRALSDTQAPVRRVAAQALGALRRGDPVPALLGRLDDAQPEVRVEVLRALGRRGDPRATSQVAARARDAAPEVRVAALQAIAWIGDPSARRAVAAALADPAQDVRREAAWTAGKLGVIEATRPLAELARKTEPLEVRRAALMALARIGSADAIASIVVAVRDDDKSAAPAREALLRLPSASATLLADALRRAVSERTAFALADALITMGAREHEPAIIQAVRDGRIGAVASAQLLMRMHAPDALTLLVEKLGDPSPAVRAEAVTGLTASLSRAPSGLPVDAILGLLEGQSLRPGERARYITALGKTKSPRALSALVTFAKSRVLAERQAAVGALGAIPDGQADAALLDALGDIEPAVREAAAEALAEGGGDLACATLLDRLERGGLGERPLLEAGLAGCLGRAAAATTRAAGARLSRVQGPTRDAIAEGLGRKGSPDARDALVALAASADVADRRKAAEALGAQDAPGTLRTLAGDPDGSVRAAALFALRRSVDGSARATLVAHLADADARAAANAASALGSRSPSPEDKASLCASLSDARATVRAAVLRALAAGRERCSDAGETERVLLAKDVAPTVRAAAARAVRASPSSPADERALAWCMATDPVFSVSRACAEDAAIPAGEEPVVVVMVGRDGRPSASAPFALELADGTVRYGVTDRRGSVAEARAPKGLVRLLP